MLTRFWVILGTKRMFLREIWQEGTDLEAKSNSELVQEILFILKRKPMSNLEIYFIVYNLTKPYPGNGFEAYIEKEN